MGLTSIRTARSRADVKRFIRYPYSRYRDDPHFDACAEFCERYDQASFDPAYDAEPVEFFEPIVRRVFAEPKYLPNDGNW